MSSDEFLLRRAVVFGAALVYWGGVLVQARRIRQQTGKTPNLRPRTAREKVLWTGWLLVIVLWMGQPFFIGTHHLLAVSGTSVRLSGLALGIALTVAGYAGTLWCYAIMGNTWRIGVNPAEKTRLVNQGPYRVIRHPIYVFQIVMLAGALLLLPTVWSVIILAIHYVCTLAKAADEEAYLLNIHGSEYGEYLARTGRFFPKLAGRTSPPG